MPAKIGRPITREAKKDIKLQIRVDKPTLEEIDALAQKLNTTRTGVIMKGIELVKETQK